jgi:hypothetical protein
MRWKILQGISAEEEQKLDQSGEYEYFIIGKDKEGRPVLTIGDKEWFKQEAKRFLRGYSDDQVRVTMVRESPPGHA